MKEIEALPGSSLGDLFTIAWRYNIKTGLPITFVHNETRVTLFTDKENEAVELRAERDFPVEDWGFELFPNDQQKRLELYESRINFIKEEMARKASFHKEQTKEGSVN